MSAENLGERPRTALEMSIHLSRLLPQMGIHPEVALHEALLRMSAEKEHELPFERTQTDVNQKTRSPVL